MAKQSAKVELFYNDQWNDHTTEVRSERHDIFITRGAGDEHSRPAPLSARLAFNSWKFNPRNVSSTLFGLIGRNTPLRISVGTAVRFVGEVSAWKPRQTLGGDTNAPIRWVEVEASGITRRLSQGADPLHSAMWRYLTSATPRPVAYWPLDGGSLSSVGHAVIGGRDMAVNAGRVAWGRIELAPFLEPGATIDSEATLAADVTMTQTPTSGTLAVLMFRAAGGDGPSGPITIELHGNTEAGGTKLVLTLTPPSTVSLTITQDGSAYASDSVDFPALFTPDLQMVEIFTNNSAGQINAFVVARRFGTFLSLNDPGQANATLSGIGHVRLSYDPGESPTPLAFAHVAIWDDDDPDVRVGLVDVFDGYPGELAGRRIERICDEEGITLVTPSGADLDDTQPMGPQYRDELLDLLRGCAEVDGGLLDDELDQAGLLFVPGRWRYNRDPVLELDYDDGHLAPPLEPAVDDRSTRNDVTVRRPDGGQARAADEDNATAIGRYTESVEANVMADSMLGDQAGWRLHLGTVEDTRFAEITVDLDANPDLATTIDGLDVGDRVTVDNLPAALTPDLASLVVLGWTETVESHRRRIMFNLAPESPFHVGEVASDDYGFIDGDPAWQFVTTGTFTSGTSTTLGVAFDGDAAGTNGLNWAGADVPILIRVAGVVLRVTAVSGTTSPHIFTVDQTPLNGVAKSIPAGSVVELANPAYIGL